MDKQREVKEAMYRTLEPDALHERAVGLREKAEDVQRRMGELIMQNQGIMEDYRLVVNIWVEKVNEQNITVD